MISSCPYLISQKCSVFETNAFSLKILSYNWKKNNLLKHSKPKKVSKILDNQSEPVVEQGIWILPLGYCDLMSWFLQYTLEILLCFVYYVNFTINYKQKPLHIFKFH